MYDIDPHGGGTLYTLYRHFTIFWFLARLGGTEFGSGGGEIGTDGISTHTLRKGLPRGRRNGVWEKYDYIHILERERKGEAWST